MSKEIRDVTTFVNLIQERLEDVNISEKESLNFICAISLITPMKTIGEIHINEEGEEKVRNISLEEMFSMITKCYSNLIAQMTKDILIKELKELADKKK